MADGAEIITLDSDDEADSSDTMSNQQRVSGGGMIFNPANYADLMSQVSQSKFMAPFTKVMQSHQKQVKPKGPKKFPKRPGVFPPFALFTQEHRENLMLENKELSFADVGRTLGEMWHKLTDTEKEDYRTRAKELTEKKLKAWQDQVRTLPLEQQQHIHSQQGHSSQSSGGMGIIKRRRTHGYAIFSSEMRKKMGDAIPLSETTRVIAEKWRNADATTRQTYEGRAAQVNEREANRYQSLLLQNQKRQQAMQLQQQQLQRQRMQLAGRQSSSSAMSQRVKDGTSASGLRISSVSSLKNNSSSKKLTPNVSLPSSISISRVEPPEDIRQRLPSSTSMLNSSSSNSPSSISSRGGMRAMPRLKRGVKSGVGATLQNSSRLTWQQRLMANPARQTQLTALQLQQEMANANGIMGSVIPGMKRAAMSSRGGKNIRKRMRGGSVGGGVTTAVKPARLCRVCCQSNVANFRIAERPDLISALEFIIDLKIDVANDKKLGLPSVICRKCCTVVITFDQFKRSVQEGQRKLEEILERRKLRKAEQLRIQQTHDPSSDSELIEVSPTVIFTNSPSGEASVSPGARTSDSPVEGIIAVEDDDSDTDVIIPNLECEVEINEDPDATPKPMSIKAEKINDIKSNSIESAKQSLMVKDKIGAASPDSSPMNEKEKDRLECDLAEFETDVIGEQLGQENNSKDASAESDACTGDISPEADKCLVKVDSKQHNEKLISDTFGKSIDTQGMYDENESSPGKVTKDMSFEQVDGANTKIQEFNDVEKHPNAQNSEKFVEGIQLEKHTKSQYEDYAENQEIEEEASPKEFDETSQQDMDLSLLHDEDGVEDSELDKSNEDDAEAIKLLNEDDDAFESFLEDGESSNDMLMPSSSRNEAKDAIAVHEIQGSHHSENGESEGTEIYETKDQDEGQITLQNEVGFESEEELIDDEMEGDEEF